MNKKELRKAVDTIFADVGMTLLSKTAFEEYFSELDTDGNGRVDILEFQTLVRQSLEAGIVLSDTGSASAASGSGSGSGSDDEVAAIKQARKSAAENPLEVRKRCKAAFAKFDSDKSGHLSKPEVVLAVAFVAKKLELPAFSDEEIDEIFADFDEDSNGTLSESEFVKFFKMALEAGLDLSSN